MADPDDYGDHRPAIDAAEAATKASRDAVAAGESAADTNLSAQEAVEAADTVAEGARRATATSVATAALAAAEAAARAAITVEADAAIRAADVATAAARAAETAAHELSALTHPHEAERIAAVVAATVAEDVIAQATLTDDAAARVAAAVSAAATTAASAAVMAALLVESDAAAAGTSARDVAASSATTDLAVQAAIESTEHTAKLALSRVARLRRAPMVAELERALEDDELRLHFQPMYDIGTGAIVGVEALIRWQHPTRGLLSPPEFLDVAEGPHLVTPIGDWVLNAAVAQATAWQREVEGEAPVMWVNISCDQLGRDHLIGVVQGLLAESGLAPGLLGIEVTERQLARRVDEVAHDLLALHELGVALAVDDFGTGYASLDYLRRFVFDEIKIDRSFVSGLQDRTNTAVTASIITLAGALDLTVVAEGVETQAQFDRLRLLGCDVAQGYLLHRPEAAEKVNIALPWPSTKVARHQPPETWTSAVERG